MSNKIPPQVGDLVRVRRRRWIVGSVNEAGFAKRKDHLVTLSSIEEDARSDQLIVIWECEPDAAIENPQLPEPTHFADPSDFECFLNAVRWGMISNANSRLVQAPFRSGIVLEDYQLDPVYRAVRMSNVNLLIADDVGLGKTIEAGLIVLELLLRHRARTVLIVCPASLQVKWQEEMRSKFGLEFRIVDTEYVRRLRRKRGIRANPWTSYPRLITSMDWAKTGDGLEYMRDVLPREPSYPRRFDILIVDEAHNVAPSPSGDSLRTSLIRRIAPHCAHHLFLTATPHNGNKLSWQGLLELLDPQRFTCGLEPDPNQTSEVVIRRLKSSIKDKDGNPLFPKRVLKEIEINYSSEERRIHQALNEYSKLRFESLQNSQYATTHTAPLAFKFVLSTLKKRLFSSPRAFHQTLQKHRDSIFSKQEERDPLPKKAEIGILTRMIHAAESEIEKPDETTINEGFIVDNENEAVKMASLVLPPLSTDERKLLSLLSKWASENSSSADSKLSAIVSWLKLNLFNSKEWTTRRVILFTEYTATLSLVHEILTNNGLGDSSRLMKIDGSTPPEEREAIKAAFQADPNISPVRILLATDAASEGIDLQNWCADLIHIEIPWNPNVMEQRNGRIDRHGQKSDVVRIWHPVGSTALSAGNYQQDDGQYLWTVCSKIDRMREDLGSVADVVAERVRNTMLGLHGQYDDIENRVKTVRKALAVQRDIGVGMKLIAETREELRLKPEIIEATVNVALRLVGRPELKPITSTGSPDDGKLFQLPELTGAWKAAWLGINDPYTGKPRPVTFDFETARRLGQNVVLLHLNHPLTALCLRVLREEVWAPERAGRLSRTTVRVLPDGSLQGIGVVTLSRLLITGSDGSRLHEEMTYAGGYMKSSGFSRERTLEVLNGLLTQGRPLNAHEIPTYVAELIRHRFNLCKDAILSATEERAETRRQSLLKKFAELCCEEQKKAEERYYRQETALKKAIGLNDGNDDEYNLTGSLFSAEDLITNLSTQTRAEILHKINATPIAIEEEKISIARRYTVTEKDARNFPIGIVFFIPESLLRES